MYTFPSRAEIVFSEAKSFFHLHTTPVEDAVLFPTTTDYIFVLNCISIASCRANVIILAYAIMDNHLHFILEGEQADCLLFFAEIKNMILRHYTWHGRAAFFQKMTPKCTPISDLAQLLTEIAYVIRNPFVVRTDVNPLAYNWCSGFLYFNPLLDTSGIPANKLKGRALRAFTFSRAEVDLDPRILVKDSVANPASFFDYRRAELFFEDARSFIMQVFKNVEAQVETAARYGERPQLNDQEMWAVSFRLIKNMFHVKKPDELSEVQKKQLVKKLREDYGGSNKQLARCTGLSLNQVNSLYPLSAPKKEDSRK